MNWKPYPEKRPIDSGWYVVSIKDFDKEEAYDSNELDKSVFLAKYDCTEEKEELQWWSSCALDFINVKYFSSRVTYTPKDDPPIGY